MLGFIGAGNMAGAMIDGILSKALLQPEEVAVCEMDPAKAEAFGSQGCKLFSAIQELVTACDTIVLAVKPQSFPQVLPEVAKTMTADKVLVSIAAGISAEMIKKAVGFDCKVILVMPNTPLMLGQGATALARVAPTTEEEFRRVRALFDAVGTTGEVPSGKMREVIPVNGSSPAFVYLFARTIVECAENHGLDGETAMALFCQTLIGSAHMLLESGQTPMELIRAVCSPGGTTLAAMRTLEDQGFTSALTKAFEACVQRAEELSEENDR